MAVCPLVPEHGQALRWGKSPSYYDWWCPNSSHNGNGFFFNDEDLLGAQAMSKDLEEVIPAVLSGDMTVNDAAAIIARRSNVDLSLAKSAIETKVRIARAYKDAKSARQTTVYKPRVKGVPLGQSTPEVPADKFMQAMTERGLTKKQAADAIGRSVSRVHELTVTQGGKQYLYDNFVKMLDEYTEGMGKNGGAVSESSEASN